MKVYAWDPFLCVNSIGIWLGFRTAFTQGLDENLRKKLQSLNLHLTRRQFVCADHLLHTIPAILLLRTLIKQKRKVPFVAVTYALTLSTWFSLHQVGKFDASDIYVPHPWNMETGVARRIHRHGYDTILVSSLDKVRFLASLAGLPHLRLRFLRWRTQRRRRWRRRRERMM